MAIVIDTNIMHRFFNDKLGGYKIVNQSVHNKSIKVVYGGTKYIEEIPVNCRPLFKILRDARKAELIPDVIIDAREAIVCKQETHPDFDDPHLIAILLESGARLICSNDARAFPFFSSSKWFTANTKARVITDTTRDSDVRRLLQFYRD